LHVISIIVDLGSKGKQAQRRIKNAECRKMERWM
jgi:hypothetical protein